MIDLILVRHAQAAPAPLGTSDHDRVLTAKGRRDAVDLADALKLLVGKKIQLFASPKARAVETADVLVGALGCEPPETALCLDGGGDPETILGALPSGGIDTLILVGHEPDMGRLLARVLDPAWRGSVPFAAGAFAQVALEAIPPRRPGRLLAFWSP